MQISAIQNINNKPLQNANFSNTKPKNISFCSNPCQNIPEMAIKQAYSLQNINYLLPTQIWSDERILKTVENFNNVIERLFSENKMKKKYLQREIGKILPNYVHARIQVRDFSELSQKSKETAAAATSTGPEGSIIYVNFLEKEHSRRDEVILKDSIGHELTHALNAQLQNTTNTLFYEHKFKPGDLSNLFINFSTPYIFKINSKYDESIDVPNCSTLLERLKVSSIEDFYNELNKKTEKLEDALLIHEAKYLNTEEKRDFYKYFAAQAKDERMAYQTTKVLRELTDGRPNALELRYVFFGELENFFNKKANGDFEISEEEEMENLREQILKALEKNDNEIN